MKDRKPVLTKADFVRRYAAGEFGNASPTWNNFADWYNNKPERFGPHQLYHIRNRIAGAETWYNVPLLEMEEAWMKATSLYRQEQLYISAMAPTEKTLIQGEVQEGVWGLELTYTTVKKPMRDALAEKTKHTRGLKTALLLAIAMNELSYAWLLHLLNTYKDHVVEFSVYSTCWGTVPGHNTVFWEVRKY